MCKQLRPILNERDQLFRWSGPSFVALLEREAPIEQVKREIGRVAKMRVEDLIEIDSRSVLLPISASWTVFPKLSSARLLMSKIDEFVTSHG
jgi:GGDEF domain-containing protein